MAPDRFRIVSCNDKDGRQQQALYVSRNEKIARGKGSIQATAKRGDALELSLDDGMTLDEWMESGRPCRVRTTDGGYFGYSRDSNLMEYFPSDGKSEAGECELEKWDPGNYDGGDPNPPSLEPPLLI